MPHDAIEGVAKHSSGLQPSVSSHAPVTAYMFSLSGADVLPRMNEGSGRSCAANQALYDIRTHLGLDPGTSGVTVQSNNLYTNAAYMMSSVA